MDITHDDIYKVAYDELSYVAELLMKSFKADPHMLWLLEKSKNKNKFFITYKHVVYETFRMGYIYMTKDKLGVALWHTRDKDPSRLRAFARDFAFVFKQGLKTGLRSQKDKNITAKHFPKHSPYVYLFMIGVSPQARGKGLASKLMDPVLEHCNLNNIPVYLETSNPSNIAIYQKRGFQITDKVDNTKICTYYMKK